MDMGGWRFHLWPIPHRIGGKWYRRQWFWYALAARSLVCWWRGHRLRWRDDPYATQPFRALECTYCNHRAEVKFDDGH